MKKAYSFMESTKTSEKHIFEGEETQKINPKKK